MAVGKGRTQVSITVADGDLAVISSLARREGVKRAGMAARLVETGMHAWLDAGIAVAGERVAALGGNPDLPEPGDDASAKLARLESLEREAAGMAEAPASGTLGSLGYVRAVDGAYVREVGDVVERIEVARGTGGSIVKTTIVPHVGERPSPLSFDEVMAVSSELRSRGWL